MNEPRSVFYVSYIFSHLKIHFTRMDNRGIKLNCQMLNNHASCSCIWQQKHENWTRACSWRMVMALLNKKKIERKGSWFR